MQNRNDRQQGGAADRDRQQSQQPGQRGIRQQGGFAEDRGRQQNQQKPGRQQRGRGQQR